MITRKFITDLSNYYQTAEKNIAREYCQHLFLSYFYKKTGSVKFPFKGGTALRIIFDSPRFSEDLDFSAVDSGYHVYEEINKLIDSAIDDIAKEGIIAEKTVNNGTRGETTGGYFAIIKLQLLEFRSELKTQISFRSPEKVKVKNTMIENKFISPYVITYLDESILVSEKIEALLSRKMPRDFFDLYFILRNRDLVKYLPKENGLKNNLITAINNFESFESELKIFLPISYHSILKDFKDRLKKEVTDLVS